MPYAEHTSTKPTLYLSPRYTSDSVALWRAGIAQGWTVERLQSRTQVPHRPAGDVAVYGEPFFAMSVASSVGIALLEPPFEWLTRIPKTLTQRDIRFASLADARLLTASTFVKPADDKCFDAGVYKSGAELPEEQQLAGSIPVLIAEPVTWEAEFRCFIVEGKVATISVYMRSGELAQSSDGSWPATEAEIDSAFDFAEIVLGTPGADLPPAVVLDIGIIRDRGWAVVEANPAWGSGIYGCDPSAVLSTLRRACVSRDTLTVCDSRWIVDRDDASVL